MFSMSLPRDNHLPAYADHKPTEQQQSAVIAANPAAATVQTPSACPSQSAGDRTTHEQSDNWFLSRSAPNSLNNGAASLEHEGGRLMYLPPWRDQPRERGHRHRQRKSINHQQQQQQLKQARSCENLAATATRPQDLQDERPQQPPPPPPQQKNGGGGRARRFTFQSTVRQIERRRLAERLSREAERKERQRLGELAAMQRVEEEFQRKRAREKANIRQQLRLYWTEETTGAECQMEPPHAPRPEPDGCAGDMADCDSTGSECALALLPPRATQVLSEYRQPQREYKEWQGCGTRAPSPPKPVASTNAATAPATSTATVHPKVVCDMPRATSHQRHDHANNYRRNFAHGVRPHTKCIS